MRSWPKSAGVEMPKTVVMRAPGSLQQIRGNDCPVVPQPFPGRLQRSEAQWKAIRDPAQQSCEAPNLLQGSEECAASRQVLALAPGFRSASLHGPGKALLENLGTLNWPWL